MSIFRTSTDRQVSVALAVLRIVTGVIFIAHGAQKLFVWGLAGVASGFAQMGIPMSGVVGPFIGLLEFFGGIALVLGLLTRVASLGLAFNMLGAILLVHLANGFFLPTGIEFALSLLGASVALVVAGAGRFSLDSLIAGRSTATATAGSSEVPAQKGSRRAA